MSEAMAEGGRPVRKGIEEPMQVPLPWVIAVLLRDRGRILLFGVVGLIVAVILALMKGKAYTSSFAFIPQNGDDGARSGLASLAGQFGISVGGIGGSSQPPQLYADLLATRSVLGRIALDSVTDEKVKGRFVKMPVFLEVPGDAPDVILENTIFALRKGVVSTSVATHTTGVVTVRVRTKSALASREIAQKLLDGINRFNTETRKSQASSERKFTETRLESEKASLRVSEDALQRFLAGNRQFGSASELAFQRERLQREVNLHQQVVQGLSQQFEDARIREVRDTPVITVIEQPSLPALHDPRGRVILVAVLTSLALFLGAALSVARAAWARQRQAEPDPSYDAMAEEWRRARGAPQA